MKFEKVCVLLHGLSTCEMTSKDSKRLSAFSNKLFINIVKVSKDKTQFDNLVITRNNHTQGWSQ